MSAFRFRKIFRFLAPSWLTTGQGELVLYSLGLILDASAERLRQGLIARFPVYAQDDALEELGRDRRVVRGPEETSDSYRDRLRSWFDDWRKAGTGFAIARRVQEYLTPHAPKIRVVNAAGTWYTLNSDGTTDYTSTYPTSNWDWDGDVAAWSRFWVIIYPPSGLWVHEGTWNDGQDWGDGGTWGTTATREQVVTIRSVIAAWKPGFAKCVNIIIALDPASFDPATAPGPPLPDGNWGAWSKGGSGSRVASRLSTARYWEGI